MQILHFVYEFKLNVDCACGVLFVDTVGWCGDGGGWCIVMYFTFRHNAWGFPRQHTRHAHKHRRALGNKHNIINIQVCSFCLQVSSEAKRNAHFI